MKILLALVAFVLVLGLMAGGVRARYADRILPGTSVAGVDVGGEEREDALAAVEQAVRAPFRVGEERVDPVAAGFDVDLEATLERAQDAGRTGPLAGLPATLASVVSSRDVEPVVTEQPKRLRSAVAAVARALDEPADPGGFRVDAETLEAEITPPREGRVLNRVMLAQRLREAARSGQRDIAPLLEVKETAKLEDVEALARAAEAYVTEPLTVRAGDDDLQLTAAQVAPALALRASQTPGLPQLGLSPRRSGPLLEKIAQGLNRTGRPPRFSRSNSSVTLTEQGDVSFRQRRTEISVRGGTVGRKVDVEETAARIARAVREDAHSVDAKVVKAKPPVTLRAARKVRYVIGTFTTTFSAGEPRTVNIRRIAREVDGSVVPVGAQFSLNAAAGRRTTAGGYVEAPFIANGKLVPSVGGGVSQFSTTVYNAAFFAGLRLDSAQPHSFYISRYPAGREATLDFDQPIDLTWTNDTDAPVVVQATSTPTSVTVRLLGDNGGRRVSSKSGPRTPVAGRDFAVTVTRRIRFRDGRVIEQPRTTSYDNPPPPE